MRASRKDLKTDFIERNSCPLCTASASSAEMHLELPPFLVLRCVSCGFLFVDRTFPPEVIRGYYAERFGSERHRNGQLVNATVNWRLFARHVQPQTVPGKALDVGCGYGFFMDKLRGAGWDVQGLELSNQEADCAEAMGLYIHRTALDSVGTGFGEFDLVTAFEVLEHVRRPVEFLTCLGGLLAPCGKLLVVTDNFASSVARAMGARFPKWIPHSHISYFGPGTLVAASRRAGLEVRQIKTFDPWEIVLLSLRAGLARSVSGRDRPGYDLDKALASEMHGEFPLFALRLLLDPIWARLTVRDGTDGSMIAAVFGRARR